MTLPGFYWGAFFLKILEKEERGGDERGGGGGVTLKVAGRPEKIFLSSEAQKKGEGKRRT